MRPQQRVQLAAQLRITGTEMVDEGRTKFRFEVESRVKSVLEVVPVDGHDRLGVPAEITPPAAEATPPFEAELAVGDDANLGFLCHQGP